MRNILIDRYKNKTITTAEIVNDLSQIYPNVNKNTIIWNLNEMIKRGDIVESVEENTFFQMSLVENL